MRGRIAPAVCGLLVAGQCLIAGSVWGESANQRHTKHTAETVGLAKMPIQFDAEHPDTAPPDGGTTQPANQSSWSTADISAGRARCQALLKDRNVVFIQAEPIKEKDCGAPAPIQLISIGSAPQVSLSPPPIVTCDMAAALSTWLDQEVQAASRQFLGGPVIRLEVMSAYSCRNAYARITARLSEHGRANALDIAGFITERGDLAGLKADWGDTTRDIQFKIAAAKAEAERLAKATTKPGTPQRIMAGAGGSINLRGSTAASEVRVSGGSLPGTALTATNPALGLAPPSRLGGPRTTPEVSPSARQAFLRRIHTGACRHFGTVLGPEANEAHRNHFHLDMAERKVKRICE
ncbi:MAG: extensin family protein [Hyphomicrobiaceae bacterium]